MHVGAMRDSRDQTTGKCIDSEIIEDCVLKDPISNLELVPPKRDFGKQPNCDMEGVGKLGVSFTNEVIGPMGLENGGLNLYMMDGPKTERWQEPIMLESTDILYIVEFEERLRSILFLMEPKAMHSLMELYQVRLGFSSKLVVDKRHHAWTLLHRLRDFSVLPWLCIGDFNEILSELEKKEGSTYPRFLMENFHDELDFCELTDTGFIGPHFTWSNKRDSGLVQERLDTGVSGFCWSQLFPFSSIENLDFWSSDHRALLVTIGDETDMLGVGLRIQRCARKLSNWNQVNQRALRQDIELKKKKLVEVSKDLRQRSWKRD
ncbi:hypothetical protein Ddye_031374 [Dipteronia dyeriana]|uniref:Endonuclease/exonuclease/phosphatase domain-containing protein n=1 Tax=Dipteronia dyeriana TaxID=168575 RepID=A0AAD9TIU3_9ROSI|nr:hypothetical protein Ddye_031374 [Dipteronia dyeriana]